MHKAFRNSSRLRGVTCDDGGATQIWWSFFNKILALVKKNFGKFF